MFEKFPVDTNAGLPEDDGAEIIDFAAVQAEVEAEGGGVEDADFSADELEAALEEAQREAA